MIGLPVKTTLAATALVLAALLGGWAGFRIATPRSTSANVVTRTQTKTIHAVPRIEQVRQLAALVTLHVPVADVQETRLSGHTGGMTVLLLVQGDVELATDLERAEFAMIDAEGKCAVLRLPEPAPRRPRLDHNASRILRLDHHGLWRIVPGRQGEHALIDRAMQEAQALLTRIADRPEFVHQAKQHTEQVITRFFAAMDWQVEIEWQPA